MAERNDEALLMQALDALEYHREQTRPIDRTAAAIEALHARLGPHRKLAGESTMLWPKASAVGRVEDMGQGNLRVVLDSDYDVCVAVFDGKRVASVEFCNPGGGGGGRSSRTRRALIELMRAIEADNAETPALGRP